MGTCPSCGSPSAPDARFCAACGTPLVRAEGWEARKVVTVVFADVTGSTALGERLDVESLRRVMARYFETASSCVTRHGGTLEKFIGDAVMAVFGIPTAHEDDALRALRAADDLRTSLPALNRELERDFGVTIRVRVGVNTGEVVVGTEERLATGDAVNVAARLEQAAAPDEILIGDETLALTRGAVEVVAAGPLSLKGKLAPIAAHRLLRVLEGVPPYERRLDTPLIGRRAEIARVRAAFERAVDDRRCHLVTVFGPPGIGKSRLAREVAMDLGDDALVLVGRCLPYGEGISYWPLREIFTAAGAEGELELALAAGSSEEIAWAVRKTLEARARGARPIALVVEDIHWAETTLLDLLEHLCDWTRDAPLCVLCLSRPELLDARPAWGSGRANAEQLTLEPLVDDEAGEMIASLLGDARLDDEARAHIRSVAEGNPLFVEQLVATMADGGTQVPSTIQALLSARLDTLTSTERELLERASVVGLDFEWEALARLSPDGQRPPGAVLGALVRKELIRPHELIEDSFRFRHMLVRDAAYERISKEVRSDLHTRVADWLDGRGDEFDEIIGYHLEQAFRYRIELGPVTERVQLLADRAAARLGASGRRALARGDDRAGVNLLERATSLYAPDDARRLRLLPALGRALRTVGRLDASEAVLSDAVERASATGDRLVVADATVALTDLRFHLKVLERREVVEVLDAVIQEFDQLGDPSGMARALAFRGKLAFWIGRAADSLDDFDRARRLAEEAGDGEAAAESFISVLVAVKNGPFPVAEALARIESMQARATGNRRLEVTVLDTRAVLEAMQMRFDVARELLAEAQTASDDVHAFGFYSSLVYAVGDVEALAGNWDAAEANLRGTCARAEEIGELGYLSSMAPKLADVLLAQGRADEALEITERWSADRLTVPEDADAHIAWQRVRAKALARAGDLVEAERLARAAVARAATTDDVDAAGHAHADLGEVLRIAGRTREAATATAEALRLFERKGDRAAAATTARLLGELSQEA
jgi:class 3 adenylate cyclase/tetratricopeptide (TPR) repeat protein